MAAKPVVPRRVAQRDAARIVSRYRLEAGEALASRFVGAMQTAYGAIGARPAAGSPGLGHALNLPGVRTWRIRGFPYLIFYRDEREHVEVWRILHMRRDIAPSLREGDSA
jgi:toxin ParE1/3/4